MVDVKSQYIIAEEIKTALTNFKKDGAARKTNEDYLQRRLNKVDELWKEFQLNHEILLKETSPTDPYFTERFYDEAKGTYNCFKQLIMDEFRKIHNPTVTPRAQKTADITEEDRFLEAQGSATPQGEDTLGNLPQGSREALKQPLNQHNSEPEAYKSQGAYSRIDEALRRQEAHFRAFQRTVANIDIQTLSAKWEYEDALKALNMRWAAIDALHLEIDSELNGENLTYEDSFARYEAEYNVMKKNINKQMWSVSHREKTTPTLEIPIFSGYYNQWVSFKDLFAEAIHTNPTISNAQKMQFLKGKIRGEAERLIQHLPITSDNYLTCWEILNHRYDNKKLIFTSHMNILFALPNIQQNSVSQIKRMHDVAMETFNAIKNLGIDITTWDPILVHILCQKLDSETYTDYLESLKNTREMPVLQELLDFLESKFTTLETSARRRQDGQQRSNIQQSNIQQYSSGYRKPSHTSNNNNYRNNGNSGNFPIAKTCHVSGFKCPLCKSDHGIYNCKFFLQMPNDKKLNTVNRLALCVNCLFSHNGKACNSTKKCRNCQGAHNTILHEALNKSMPSLAMTSQGKDRVGNTTHVAQTQDKHSEILLATAQVRVLGADGEYYKMRALIDQGSQISLISEQAAQTLRIKREKCRGMIFGIGQRENNCKGKLNITCQSNCTDYTFQAEVVIMNNLIKNLPNKTFNKPTWPNIENINLADPEFYISRPVDLLLGADVYSNIIMDGIIRSEDASQPMAQRSHLGWLLCGNAETFYCNVVIDNVEDLQQFWEIEDITEEETLSSDDMHCLKYFYETTTRNKDGRYQVRLPMKPDFEKELGSSKQKAIAQFRNLEQKFEKQPKLAADYKTCMKEYEELKHMTPASGNATLECYLPHHGVERAESLTTKYRVVFNASAKTSSGHSLNSLMYKGPCLQKDLLSLLLRWRQYEFSYTADIEKMYRQIMIHDSDATLQRIIWRESPEQPLQTYILRTLTYGTKPAPFLAMMTLKKLAEDERENFPEAVKVLENAFYMDDLVHGAYSIEQGKKMISDLDQLLKTGGFNLRKWSANNSELLEDVTEQQDSKSVIFNFKSEIVPKTLGICWNPSNDKLTFRYETTKHTKLTKRILLSEISKLYDPLGFAAPVVTKLKILFQKVWRADIQWDSEVPEDICREWNKAQFDLHKLSEYEIPRWLQSREHDVIELHGFCDASLAAYGCVIYARTRTQQNVVLVAAKTKLVAIKTKITLPKLELSGACLLAKLMNKVKQALDQHELNIYGWTDSKVALGWLQGEPGRWKPFVANRVKQVTEIMPARNWHYVETSENPSDAASRGLYASQLLSEQSLWKQGPAWLATFEPEKIVTETFTTEQEKKLSQTNIVQHCSTDPDIIEQLLQKHSSFNKILHIVAWIQRALTPKHKHRTSYLTLQELRKAKLTIIKYVQQRHFIDEWEHLRKHKHVQSQSKLKDLNPFIDQQQILRVRGRLNQAIMSDEMKHPKIIPKDTRLATLLIQQAHKLTLHGGATVTLAALRQEYWITGGYNTVKKELRNCITCRKQERKTRQQLMGDLPAARCNPAEPFYHTGVDYTGAVDIKASKGRGARTVKGYVAVFVCMVTKAAHLELVTEMSSAAFLAALRRMAARRGAPRHIYSDQGTNFVGANRILQQEHQHLQHITDNNFLAEVAGMNIEWHFNAPAYPSAGGLWEKAVGSLKYHLRRVVGEQKLTYEEYSTILSQIEACLNSRPLCALSEDVDNLDFLTPAHFLTTRPGVTIIETAEDARTRWHLCQKLRLDIWKRWKTEYLTQLTARRKWQVPQQNIEIGDMVVIHEDNLPPGKWALGRVIDTHPGNDGYVRVVTIKTKNGILKRPVLKLSVLPIKEQSESSPSTTKERENKIHSNSNNKQKPKLLSLALMFIYFLAVITQGSCLQTTPLRENQALYFDKVSNMQIIRDEWKIIAYYDLNPYWEGNVAFMKYYQHLDGLCNEIKQVSHCGIIVLQLRHNYDELEHNNKVLLKQQLKARARRKRGLVDGIGNIANSLFGVLDSRFAEQYQRDISLVRQNQKHLAQLWKNQTSVIEAEFNLIQRTEDTMNKQHKIINQHLTQLEMNTFAVTKQVNEMDITAEFTLIAMAANNILTHLKSIQVSLLDTITDIYNGHINMNLITPQQLQNELSTISGQLDKELTLPIDNIQLDLPNIYHLLRIKCLMTKLYIIFEIRIPLISRDNYDLYNIHAIPHQTDGNMLMVIPIEDHVAMNLQKDVYLPVTSSDLEHCLSRDTSTYLCQLNTPIYKMKTDHDLCVRELNTVDRCKTNIIACQNKWISLSKSNQYLYFCCNTCHIRTLCKDQVTAHQLAGANIIDIPEDCLIKMDNLTVYTLNRKESTIHITPKIEVPGIAPINNVINITISKPIIDNSTLDKTQFLKAIIENKIKIMKEEQPLSDGISVHDVHHYILIYSILIIGAITALIIGWRRWCYVQQCQQQTDNGQQEAGGPPPQAAAAAGREPIPRPVTSNSNNELNSARVQLNECDIGGNSARYKERGTTPVLRKIAFSEDSV